MDDAIKSNPHALSATDVDYWKDRLRQLPDLRLDKVLRTREALRRNSYDCDDVLDVMIDRLHDEIAILCREAS